VSSWALVVTRNPLVVPTVEEASRLAGLSPRRAPDLAGARVLCASEEPPGVVIVDPASCGEEAFAVAEDLAAGSLIIVLRSPDRPDDEARAERLGGWALGAEELADRLPSLV
jgi:DNA-binding response OmpR family regulator